MNRDRIPAILPAIRLFMLSRIHSSPDKCTAMISSNHESPFTSLTLPLLPSRLLRVQPSAAATVEDRCCRLPPPPALAAGYMRQPTSNPALASGSIRQNVGLCQATLRRRSWESFSYPVLSSRANYSLNFSLVMWRHSSRGRVTCDQG